jgi:hypothetical protein
MGPMTTANAMNTNAMNTNANANAMLTTAEYLQRREALQKEVAEAADMAADLRLNVRWHAPSARFAAAAAAANAELLARLPAAYVTAVEADETVVLPSAPAIRTGWVIGAERLVSTGLPDGEAFTALAAEVIRAALAAEASAVEAEVAAAKAAIAALDAVYARQVRGLGRERPLTPQLTTFSHG